MKSYQIAICVLLILSSCSSSKKLTYTDSVVINAKTDWTEYKVGNEWYRSDWSIAPEVDHDTLEVICYRPSELFVFKTDIDSISFELKANTTKSFYVRMDNKLYAHTIIKAIAFNPNELSFDKSKNPELQIKYQINSSTYLTELRQAYPLDFIDKKLTDREIVLQVLNWTNSRWNHSGNNSPSKNDAITILSEAEEGQQFPCFAYAVVLRDQLNSIGYKARTIYLKTSDAKSRLSPPGHVGTEVYLEDLQKWVFIDGQFNVMPSLNDIPLNAVEFQSAISNEYDQFVLQSLSAKKTTKERYVDFIYDYLYYFDTTLDNRYQQEQAFKIDNKTSIMLIPIGAENLTYINFWKMEIDYCHYTNSLSDFYDKPK